VYSILGIDFARQRMENVNRRAVQAALLRNVTAARPEVARRQTTGGVASGHPARANQRTISAQPVTYC
jgi:hypothetical protein